MAYNSTLGCSDPAVTMAAKPVAEGGDDEEEDEDEKDIYVTLPIFRYTYVRVGGREEKERLLIGSKEM